MVIFRPNLEATIQWHIKRHVYKVCVVASTSPASSICMQSISLSNIYSEHCPIGLTGKLHDNQSSTGTVQKQALYTDVVKNVMYLHQDKRLRMVWNTWSNSICFSLAEMLRFYFVATGWVFLHRWWKDYTKPQNQTMCVDYLPQPLTPKEQQLKSRLPNTPMAKRLEEFQVRFLVFGVSKKATTVKTQAVRYHRTIPTSLTIPGRTVNWMTPMRIPVVSTSCPGPFSQSWRGTVDR